MKSRRNAGNILLAFVEALNSGETGLHQFLNMVKTGSYTGFADPKQNLFSFIEKLIYIRLIFIASCRNFSGGGYQLPQNGLLLDHLGVVDNIGGARDGVNQFRNEYGSADIFEDTLFFETGCECY